MYIQANEEGFTIWADQGYIIADCPLERLKNDHALCMFLLEGLNYLMLNGRKKI